MTEKVKKWEEKKKKGICNLEKGERRGIRNGEENGRWETSNEKKVVWRVYKEIREELDEAGSKGGRDIEKRIS